MTGLAVAALAFLVLVSIVLIYGRMTSASRVRIRLGAARFLALEIEVDSAPASDESPEPTACSRLSPASTAARSFSRRSTEYARTSPAVPTHQVTRSPL